MVYMSFLLTPQILGVAGMDTSAVFVTTCLIAAFGSILMGLFANTGGWRRGDGAERVRCLRRGCAGNGTACRVRR